MKFYAFCYLLSYALLWLTIRRVEGIIIAIGASPGSLAAIAVGTGKTGINGYFLNTLPESTAKIFAIGVVAFGVMPGIVVLSHDVKVKKEKAALLVTASSGTKIFG